MNICPRVVSSISPRNGSTSMFNGSAGSFLSWVSRYEIHAYLQQLTAVLQSYTSTWYDLGTHEAIISHIGQLTYTQ